MYRPSLLEFIADEYALETYPAGTTLVLCDAGSHDDLESRILWGEQQPGYSVARQIIDRTFKWVGNRQSI